MVFCWQLAHDNVYRSSIELFLHVDWAMKVEQLVSLRASKRYRRTLRITVEVHHIYVLSLLILRASYLTKQQIRRKANFSKMINPHGPSYTTNSIAKQQ